MQHALRDHIRTRDDRTKFKFSIFLYNSILSKVVDRAVDLLSRENRVPR
jgi:hypothetical protein